MLGDPKANWACPKAGRAQGPLRAGDPEREVGATMAIILNEPQFIRQEKTFSCWFACLKMLLLYHEGNRSISNSEVSGLSSWTTGRSFSELPQDFLRARKISFVNQRFRTIAEIENELQRRGPFVGGGAVGKMFLGPRLFGHAILIYGVMPDQRILHHDPMVGRASTISGAKYLSLQDGERLHYTGR